MRTILSRHAQDSQLTFSVSLDMRMGKLLSINDVRSPSDALQLKHIIYSQIDTINYRLFITGTRRFTFDCVHNVRLSP